MMRVDLEGGGSVVVSTDIDSKKKARPLVNVRIVGRGGSQLLLLLREHEALAVVRALLAGGEKSAADIAAEREQLVRLCGVRS